MDPKSGKKKWKKINGFHFMVSKGEEVPNRRFGDQGGDSKNRREPVMGWNNKMEIRKRGEGGGKEERKGEGEDFILWVHTLINGY